MSFRSRSRRGQGIRPVNRIKHVKDSQGGAVLGTQIQQSIITTVDAPVLANTNEVETGSVVNGIYLKVEVYATSEAALANVYLAIFKNPGGNLTAPVANIVGSNDNKKYVIHQEMVMVEQKISGNVRTLFNGVIVIPRGYRRNGPDDDLSILLFSPGVNFNFCWQAHYKEFR